MVHHRSPIALGDRFTLRSGFLEITYDTGAKVLLQGRVAYEVESTNGGYLPVGKLTGKVTTRAARGLTIRTPTVVVTDLGTEFGVLVAADHTSTVRVFKGVVEVKPTSMSSDNARPSGNAKRLTAGETIRVESTGISRRVALQTTEPSFVHRLPQLREASGLRRDLVAYWSFDDAGLLGKNALDSVSLLPTRASDIAALPPTYEQNGVLGGAVRLHGGTNGSTLTYRNGEGVPNGVPTGNSSYSVSAWFRTNPQADFKGKLGILGWGNWKAREAFVLVVGRSAENDFVQTYWVDNNDYDIFANTRPGTWMQGWHHVVTSYNAETNVAHTFIDGASVVSIPMGGHPKIGTGNFAVGRGWFLSTDQEFFDGWLDEIGIWSRELSKEEVQELYNKGKALNPLAGSAH
jgi:hypothetical protein